MGEDIREECGIAAVALKKPLEQYGVGGAAIVLKEMLRSMQNRGQESGGIVTHDHRAQKKLKEPLIGIGLIPDVFSEGDASEHERIMRYYNGYRGIGHVRYSTSGGGKANRDLLAEAQPMYRSHGKTWKRFAIAFNGNLANYPELAEELVKEHDYDLETTVDTEVIMHFLSIDLKSASEDIGGKKPDIVEVIRRTSQRLDGAYNIALINGLGELVVWTDPYRIKPLAYVDNEDIFAVASETTALDTLGISRKDIRKVEAGQVLIYD